MPSGCRREERVMNAADNRIRLVVADDHTLFREGLVELLSQEPDLAVTGQADSGDALLATVRKTHPDVAMLDIEMPGPPPETTVREVLREFPATRVIVLTMHDHPALVERMLAAGAAAYVIKSANRETLLAAIRGARRDDEQVVVSVSRETMARMVEPAASPLSPREFEVLKAVSSGLSNAQIAARLFITEGTVKRHLTNIYMKLEVTTRMNAINKAIVMGLIEPKEFQRPAHGSVPRPERGHR